jgi:hypothetical protein
MKPIERRIENLENSGSRSKIDIAARIMEGLARRRARMQSGEPPEPEPDPAKELERIRLRRQEPMSELEERIVDAVERRCRRRLENAGLE